jgi:hypothetical protein
MRALSIIFALLAAAVASHAQTVYSVGVYSMGRTYEHDWTVHSGSTRFGFDQYRQYQDASGRKLNTLSDVIAKGVASPRYTTVYCGPFSFTVRGPAWLAALVVAVGVASLLLLVIGGVGRIRRHPTHADNAA